MEASAFFKAEASRMPAGEGKFRHDVPRREMASQGGLFIQREPSISKDDIAPVLKFAGFRQILSTIADPALRQRSQNQATLRYRHPNQPSFTTRHTDE
jgi:hypothetical protein